MLRLPQFELTEPATLAEACALLAEHGDQAQLIAGGTDLLPNMKHELFTPRVVISLAKLRELHGLCVESDGTLVLGAMTSLDTLAHDERVRARAPALAQAAGLVAGPQLRRMGTLGGNVMLDTRCQWYNQTYFWRSALGFCLKKDGSACHVVAGGAKCVAAASNDTAPALMSLDAMLVFQGGAGFHGGPGRRTLAIDELYTADGIHNKSSRAEILVEVRVPPVPPGHRGAYGKLRERGSIDFPLLGLAARVDLSPAGEVVAAALCAVALQARPLRLQKAIRPLLGTRPGTPAFRSALESAGELARKQCHPLANIPGDPDYRREMVPVYVRRTLTAAVEGTGPVHHI
ncbi:MAG: 4-hydroxybenzoyl-CoA reductase subunit beta [Planctomycetes bacterium]|nr:4-hydroxybenzoyl-CoA reductase subunit beta [Planctomycetota bacterium]